MGTGAGGAFRGSTTGAASFAPVRARRARAFTMVELVVAVGIIVLLAGLAVTAMTAVVERSAIRETRTALQRLDLAVREWETATGRKLTFGHRETDDINEFTDPVLITTALLERIRHVDAVDEVLARFPPERVYVYEEGVYPAWIYSPTDGVDARAEMDRSFVGGIAVLDAWGWPVYATHPGGAPYPGSPADPDGTGRTYNEQRFGVARNRRVCFVSGGPDRTWGDLFLGRSLTSLSDEDRALLATTDDNVYSYAPILDRVP